MIDTRIIWTLEGVITNPELYAKAMKVLTEKSLAELGTKSHWWTVSQDGIDFHILEQYDNQQAAIEHLATWAEYGHLFTDATVVSRFVVYGDISDELKGAVAGLNPIYMNFYGGFSR